MKSGGKVAALFVTTIVLAIASLLALPSLITAAIIAPGSASNTGSTTANTQAAAAIGNPPAGTLPNVPAYMVSIYQEPTAHAQCPGLPWTVLAAIGHVETGDNSNHNVSSAGALGPMQFLQSTFDAYATDGDGNGTADILSPADAVATAAKYLCASGGGNSATLKQAIFAYNHSSAYVDDVLGIAASYDSDLAKESFAITTVVSPGTGAVSRYGLSWPVSATYPIGSCWNELRGTAHHPGMDISVPTGTPIQAAGDGTVEAAGYVGDGSYGIEVVINHHNGLWTLYGHNEQALVAVGQVVKRGQVIALSDSTGDSTGPHSHFGVEDRPGDAISVGNGALNPLDYLPNDGRNLVTSNGLCAPGATGYAGG